MKRLIRKLLVFLVIFVSLMAIVLFGSRTVMQRGDFYRLKPDTKYLMVGHSHMECDIDDSQIAHAQNVSAGGESYFFTYQKVRILLQDNPSVKTLFVSFANNQIEKGMDKWIWEDKVLYNYMPKYSYFMDAEDYGVLLAKNPKVVGEAQIKSIKDFSNFMFTNRKDVMRNRNWGGYLFLRRQKVDSLLKTSYLADNRKNYNRLSMTNIKYLEKIVALCKKSGVRVILVRLPAHPLTPMLSNERTYQQIRKRYFGDVDYFDFLTYNVPNAERGDFDHLNHTGAKRFSVFFNALLENRLLEANHPQQMIDAAIQENNMNQYKKS